MKIGISDFPRATGDRFGLLKSISSVSNADTSHPEPCQHRAKYRQDNLSYETSSKDKDGNNQGLKEFYKTALTIGEFNFHYADKSFETDETFLFLSNPHIPHSCEIVSSVHSGYTCLFSEEFLKPSQHYKSVLQSPLFKIGVATHNKFLQHYTSKRISRFIRFFST